MWILITIGVLLLISLLYAWFSLAPWFPTKKEDLERLHKIGNLKPGQKFLELGCGDARVCSYIAKRNPKAQIVGIELALFFYIISKLKTLFLKNCDVRFGNALKTNFNEFDVIYVFGLTETVNQKLKTKLEQEMKTGATFVSYNFQIQSWKGKTTKNKPTPESSSIYIYKKT